MSTLPEIERRPTVLSWTAGILVIAVTTTAIVGLPRLSFDDNYMEVFRNEKAEFKQYEQLLDTFGSDDMDCYVLVERESILADESIRALRRVHDTLEQLDDVERVFSIFSTRTNKRVGRYLLPVFSYELEDPELIERGRSEIRVHPIAQGNLLEDSESATLIVARLKGRSLSVAELTPPLERLRSAVAQATKDSDLKASVTGVPAIRVEITESVRRDNILFTTTGLLLACTVALLLFRRIAPMLIVSIAPTLGVLWTLGAMSWWGESLNVINVIVPALLIVIGFTDSVHLMFHIRRLRDRGVAAVTAARSALREIGPACVLTSITTAIGFGSLAFTEDNVISRFGITSAIGTTITMAAVLVVVPLLSVTPLGRYVHSSRRAARWVSFSCTDWMLDPILKYPRRITIAAAIGVIAMLFASFQLQADFRYGENMPADHETQLSLHRCDTLFGGASAVYAILQVPPQRSLRDPQLHDMLAAVHAVFDRHEETGTPLSLRNLLQSLPGKRELHRRIGQLRYLPREVLAGFVNTDTRQVLVTARTPDAGALRMKPVFDSIRGQFAQLNEQFPDYQVQLVGMPVMATYLSKQMIGDLALSLQLASISIFAVMTLTLGSVRLGLRSLLPNVFPLAALGATLYVSGRPLMYSGVICFSICLGIAVDDTIHFLVRYRRELEQDGDVRGAIRRTHETITPVLLTTTVLMLAGFGTTLLSSLPTIWMFGVMSCAALIYALAGDLVILPALLAASIPSDAPRDPRLPVRRAGLLERPFFTLPDAFSGRFDYALVFACDRQVDIALLRARLKLLVERSPVLRDRLSHNRRWWYPDTDFSLSRHLVRQDVSASGDALVGAALQATGAPLSPDHPLWRVNVVSGTSAPQAGPGGVIVIRIHRGLLDAEGAMRLFAGVLADRDVRAVATADEQLRGMLQAVGRSPRLWAGLRRLAGDLVLRAARRPATKASSWEPTVHTWQAPRQTFRQIARHFECSISASLLSVVAGAARKMAQGGGASPSDAAVLCPVAVRSGREPIVVGNQIIPVRVKLPVSEPGTAIRVAETARRVKASRDASAGGALRLAIAALRRTPSWVRDRLIRWIDRQTDFRCSILPAYELSTRFGGAQIVTRLATAPLASDHGLAVTCVVGKQSVLITAVVDPQVCPGGGQFAETLDAALGEIQAVIEPSPAAAQTDATAVL